MEYILLKLSFWQLSIVMSVFKMMDILLGTVNIVPKYGIELSVFRTPLTS